MQRDQQPAQPRPESSEDPDPLFPLWIDESARLICGQLRSEIAKHGRPLCYLQGSLSIMPPNPLFIVDKRFQPTPYLFYKSRFDIWMPHYFVSKIPCPGCRKSGRLNSSKKTPVLQKKGFPTDLRRIVDIDRVIYLVGYRYFCGTCNTSIVSHDPALLEVLPPLVQHQFTHHLTHRTGITDQLATLLRSCIQHSIGPGPFAKMLEGFHHRRYELQNLQYLELVKERKHSGFRPFLSKCEPFSAFRDRAGYGGYVPGPAFFKRFYVMFSAKHAEEVDQHRKLLPVRILSIDQSFKVS